jgi:hypothetical protein
MHARVARFEGADAEKLKETSAEIRNRSDSGPPEGVPGKAFLLLNDFENGKSLAITLFETEDDYRQGDEKLNSMSPPVDSGMGQRVAVEKYEVSVKMEA